MCSHDMYRKGKVSMRDAQLMIMELAKSKGWGADVAIKIYYGMIELGEAGDIWKHREDEEYLKELGIDDVEKAVAIEIIDTLYYCLHALYCLNPALIPEDLFLEKFEINEKRNRYYVDD